MLGPGFLQKTQAKKTQACTNGSSKLGCIPAASPGNEYCRLNILDLGFRVPKQMM